jgi:hypothetical protein
VSSISFPFLLGLFLQNKISWEPFIQITNYFHFLISSHRDLQNYRSHVHRFGKLVFMFPNLAYCTREIVHNCNRVFTRLYLYFGVVEGFTMIVLVLWCSCFSLSCTFTLVYSDLYVIILMFYT